MGKGIEVQEEIIMPLLELTTFVKNMLNPITCTSNVRLFQPAWTVFRLQLLHRRQHLTSHVRLTKQYDPPDL